MRKRVGVPAQPTTRKETKTRCKCYESLSPQAQIVSKIRLDPLLPAANCPPAFDLSKASLLDHPVELVFGKAKPLVTIKLTGLFKLVLFQVEDDQLTILLESPKGFGKSGFRTLVHDGGDSAPQSEVYARGGQGHFFYIPMLVTQVRQVVLFGQFFSNPNHAL